MRKLVLLAAFAVFGFTQVNAQVKFGAKAGANLANIVGEDTDDTKMLFGFHIGAVAEFAITEDFLVAPELLFSTQGTQEEYTIFGVDVTEKLKTNYLYVPIMAKYQVFDGLTLEAGPQFGFLLSAKAEVEATFGGETESDSEDVKEFMSSMDIGLGIGLGYRMQNGLFFQARYNIGLSNINDFDGSDKYKQQNSVIQISVGYFFN